MAVVSDDPRLVELTALLDTGVRRRPTPEQVLDRLSGVDLLRALPPDEVHELIPFVVDVEVPVGEAVVTQGDQGDALYIIEHGRARVALANGTEIAHIGAGDVFGEMALLTGEPRAASVIAESNLTVWRLRRDDFERIVKTSPAFEQALQEAAERHRAGLPLTSGDAAVRRAWLGAALRSLAVGGLTMSGFRAAEERVTAAIQRKRAARDVNRIHDESMTFGQRVADRVANTMGSWPFIIVQSTILAAWVVLNVTELVFKTWDPYPFILMNLLLSLQAAYAAPVIMMSQNRQAAKDRLASELDLRTNLHAETLIEELHARMEDLRLRQWNELMELQERQIEALQDLLRGRAAAGSATGPDAEKPA